MKQETQKGSKLPIVLTRRLRHQTKTGDWELEFSLEEPNKKKGQEQAPARLRIIGTALERTERNRLELKHRSSITLRLEGLEDLLREIALNVAGYAPKSSL